MPKKTSAKGKVVFSSVAPSSNYEFPILLQSKTDLQKDPFLDELLYEEWEEETYNKLRAPHSAIPFFKSCVFNKSDIEKIAKSKKCEFICFTIIFLKEKTNETTSLFAFGLKNNDPIIEIDPNNPLFFVSPSVDDTSITEETKFDFSKTSFFLSSEKNITWSKATQFGSQRSSSTKFLKWAHGFDIPGAIIKYPKKDKNQKPLEKIIRVFFPVQDLNKTNLFTDKINNWDRLCLYPIILYAKNSGTEGVAAGNLITYLILPVNNQNKITHYQVNGNQNAILGSGIVYPPRWKKVLIANLSGITKLKGI